MEWIRNPWLLAVVVLIVAQAFIVDVADAKCVCEKNRGDSTTEALGEEFPETSSPATSADTDALGEEFPE
ncbi:MAG: hypothetical protein KAY24_18640 [Candidatus Eisenbacteria sp.]|nr:hypothetical protein [Candidatus Eisenbacteria bacterium]